MKISKIDDGGYYLTTENDGDENLIKFLMSSTKEKNFSIYEEEYKNDIVGFAEDFWFAECRDGDEGEKVAASLRTYQKELLERFATGASYVVTSKRQCGMSEMLMCFAMWKAAVMPDTHVLLLVPSIQMLRTRHERMNEMCTRLYNEGRMIPLKQAFEFPNGSTIKINTVSRGYTANTLIVDDFLFFEEGHPTDVSFAIGQQTILTSSLPNRACSAMWESANDEKSGFSKLAIEKETNGTEKFKLS